MGTMEAEMKNEPPAVDAELNAKAKAKLEELKRQRMPKDAQQNLAVTVSKDRPANFQLMYQEVTKLAQMHMLQPDEMYMLGCHMQWLAVQLSDNMRMQSFQNGVMQAIAKKDKPFVERREEKLKKEEEDGKVRVKPEQEETK